MSSSSDSTSLIMGGVLVVLVMVGCIYFFVLKSNSAPTVLPLEDFIPVPLLKKDILSHDTVKFTFGLPNPQKSILGLQIGQHVSLRYTDTSTKQVYQRSYTPVSAMNQIGFFELVIKVYKPNPPQFPEGGKMSQHLDSLQIGETIMMKGPKGHLHYHSNGNFTVKPLGKPFEERKCLQIGLIAGGTGITPILQILHAIFVENMDLNRNVSVHLIYANKTIDDILVRNELEEIQRQNPTRFKLWYTVDKVLKNSTTMGSMNSNINNVEQDWKYDIGFVTKKMIEEHLVFQQKEIPTQFFMCGPPGLIKFACVPALQELGYNEKNWVVL